MRLDQSLDLRVGGQSAVRAMLDGQTVWDSQGGGAPDVYWTDFSEYDLGDFGPQQGTTWLAAHNSSLSTYFGRDIVTGPAGSVGGKSLRLITKVLTARRAVLVNQQLTAADHEIVVRFRFTSSSYITSTVSAWNQPVIIAGANDSATIAGAVAVDGWWTDRLMVRERLAETTEQTFGEIVKTWSHDWMWARLRVDGGYVSAKMWMDADPEPSTWDVDSQGPLDSPVGAGGMAGVGVWGSNASGYDVDVVGIATNGETAPMDDPTV
jgi:hypothetical protein